MGILLVYDVTDERSFNSKIWASSRLDRIVLILFPSRHPDMVLQRRTARYRRRQQDPHRQQMRLGREKSSINRTRPAASRRARHPIHGGFRQRKHQHRKGFLQPSSRHQEANHRHLQAGSRRFTRRQCGGSEQQHEQCHGREMLLGGYSILSCEGAGVGRGEEHNVFNFLLACWSVLVRSGPV